MRGFLCLGSNLGDRQNSIMEALKRLKERGIRVLRTSSIYETVPVGVDECQDNYYNLVAAIDSELTPQGLLKACAEVEESMGRLRPYRNASRTIDIDILMLEGVSIRSPELEIPHPRMEERSFVVYPLWEIEPDIVMPSGRYIIEVKNALPDDEIVRMWTPSDG